MDGIQVRHFEDTDLIMGLYVKEYFDPFRPDELIDKLIDRCCTIRQNINKPLLHCGMDAPVNMSQHRSTMTLVGVVTGFVELRFAHYSVILEPGEMTFMPPGSDYLVLPIVIPENPTAEQDSTRPADQNWENPVDKKAAKPSDHKKYEARLVYAEYPTKANYF